MAYLSLMLRGHCCSAVNLFILLSSGLSLMEAPSLHVLTDHRDWERGTWQTKGRLIKLLPRSNKWYFISHFSGNSRSRDHSWDKMHTKKQFYMCLGQKLPFVTHCPESREYYPEERWSRGSSRCNLLCEQSSKDRTLRNTHRPVGRTHI